MDDVILEYHFCYSPFIYIAPEQHVDINGNIYYRAFYTHPSNKRIGFIVRNTFLQEWNEFSIAEIHLTFTSKGATLLHYETFETLSKKRGIEFIEIQGIYISGQFQLPISENYTKEVAFLPSIPNNFSFGFCNRDTIKSFTLKRFSLDSYQKIYGSFHKIDLYDREVIDYLNEETECFFILKRIREEVSEYENAYGSVHWETLYHEEYSIVFRDLEDFLLSSQLDKKYIADINEFVARGRQAFEKEIELMKAVKLQVKKMLKFRGKICYRYDDTFFFLDEEIIELLAKIKGRRYLKDYYFYGLEDNLSSEVDLGDGFFAPIFESIYLEVIFRI